MRVVLRGIAECILHSPSEEQRAECCAALVTVYPVCADGIGMAAFLCTSMRTHICCMHRWNWHACSRAHCYTSVHGDLSCSIRKNAELELWPHKSGSHKSGSTTVCGACAWFLGACSLLSLCPRSPCLLAVPVSDHGRQQTLSLQGLLQRKVPKRGSGGASAAGGGRASLSARIIRRLCGGSAKCWAGLGGRPCACSRRATSCH